MENYLDYEYLYDEECENEFSPYNIIGSSNSSNDISDDAYLGLLAHVVSYIDQWLIYSTC